MMKLVLASTSPRRKELLGKLGLEFSIRAPNFVETRMAEESAFDYVKRNAKGKAESVFQLLKRESLESDFLVLGSDTVVVHGEAVLEKPKNEGEARSMLNALSGRNHQVLTGYSLLSSDSQHSEVTSCVSTVVEFRKLFDEEIESYLKSGEPMDKAGSYGIQSIGASFVRSIHGSYTNVVGLPLAEVFEDLSKIVGSDFVPLA